MCEQDREKGAENTQVDDAKYMSRCCVKVNPYLSEIIQRVAFQNNVGWYDCDNRLVQHTQHPYLLIDFYPNKPYLYFSGTQHFDKQILSVEDFLLELAKPVKPVEEIIKVANEPIVFGSEPNNSGIEYQNLAYSRREIKKILAAWDAVQLAPELTTRQVRFVQNQGIE